MAKKRNRLKIPRNWLLLGGGVLFALLAALFAMLYLKNIEAELIERNKPKVEQDVAVVVAGKDLGFGSKMDEQNMAVRRIPAGLAQTDVITPAEFANYKGRVLKQAVKAGRPVLKSFLVDQVPLDFSDTVPVKRRGLTVQVDELNSFAGLLRPGDRVDLFASLPGNLNPTDKKVPTLIPVVQNVRVLATGKDSQHDYVDKLILGGMGQPAKANEDYTNITVDVTPRQAALISMAREKGHLVSLLRNRKDTGLADFSMLTSGALFDNAGAMAAAARALQQASSTDGIRLGKDGKLRTANGQVISDPNVVMKNGQLMTKDGVVLSGRGLTVGKDGKIYDANGKLVDTTKLTQTADGRLITQDGQVLGSNGMVTAPDGSVRTTDGRRVTKDGFIVNPDGTVTTQSGVVLKGVKVLKDGSVVGADGKVIKSGDIVLNKDGSISTRSGQRIAGVTGRQGVVPRGDVPEGYRWLVEYIVGGSGSGGVTPVKEVPVEH